MTATADKSARTLHILNKAPSHARYAACLAQVDGGDALVLIEDGVLALSQLPASMPGDVVVYALESDARARGVEEQSSRPGRKSCSMDDLVELTQTYPRIINW